MPLGKRAPVPVNMEAARKYPIRDREWLKRVDALIVGGNSNDYLHRSRSAAQPIIRRCLREQQSAVGHTQSESNRKRLSASKGTREAQPSRAVARIGRLRAAESLPMRRLGGGASVVVRGRESRPHGKGRQDVSFRASERFSNREGSR
jgi:hypothetical protein